MKIKIGTRGSNLALTQTKWVESQLKKDNPEVDIEIIIIKTKGDKILDVALDKIGDKGLFVKELEQALYDKTIDIAVHSMKDMPSEAVEGLSIAPTPIREDHRDVLILKEGYSSLNDIPIGGVVGTGSKRRCYQLALKRPDLKFEPIRGNIETRIRKLTDLNLDAIVLAAAGIKRLGLESVITTYLEDEDCLAAPAQGALAIQYRSDDKKIEEVLIRISDFSSQKQIEAERSFLLHTNGGCHAPIGAHAKIDGDYITLEGVFGLEDGSKIIRKSMVGKLEDSTSIGETLAKEILKELSL